ncbi:MAG: DNA-binding response regulator [Epsilonproteobacteria bacterium]|nr:MAG: DNA-binding response regulator [Campylobacterota bacterium]
MINTKYPFKILFVEDEVAIRANYIEYLNIYFEEVYEAEDGEKAYEIYKQKKPDILIVDINVPLLNGLDLLKKIREDDHATRAIMLTAYKDVDFLLKATTLKLTKYLVKPVSRHDLKESLETAVLELSKFNVIQKKKIHLRDNYSWDYEIGELSINHSIVSLTDKEKQVFTLLISTPKKIFSVDEIVDSLWNTTSIEKQDSLKTIIKMLRRKLPQNTIKNVFGVGYKIDI